MNNCNSHDELFQVIAFYVLMGLVVLMAVVAIWNFLGSEKARTRWRAGADRMDEEEKDIFR